MSKTIWVVDDDLGILEVIKIILEEQGYQVVTINDCSSIKKRVNNKLPNLILLDILMKGENGQNIARFLKNNKKTQSIPIVMVSADYKTEEKTKEAGADDFLKKPFNINDLISIVKKYIKK